MRRSTTLPIQLNRLIGRKDEVVLGGFPGLGIGRI